MRKPVLKLSVMLIVCLVLSSGCIPPPAAYRLPKKHPLVYDLAKRREFCTSCHGYKKEPVDFERYNHTLFFTDSHRLVAYQDDRICALCHEQSFCNDCHVNRSEMTPSVKNPTENYRRMQHRGDYLSRHRIDGRVDPTSCFRCHGNPKSSTTCQPCHG